MSVLREVALEDKYLREGPVYLTGTQALVRLPLLQKQRDRAAGLDTAGMISGYRGSPLGGYDIQLQRESDILAKHDIRFLPAVNEELAATLLWGTQQAGLRDKATCDGVFGIWYGKGPGVDRSGDAFRHANLSGTSPGGGVLALLGDDHTCESSTTCHQSEFAMVDAMIPVISPSGIAEIIQFGLHGWSMSRYSGCWAALKCVHDTVSTSASIDLSKRTNIIVPGEPRDVHIRTGDTPQAQEARLHELKLPAAHAYWRSNQLDRVVMDCADAKIGIVTAGKSYLDVQQALTDLGIDAAKAKSIGLRIYKIGLVWPLEPTKALEVLDKLDLVLVVEEKRALIEPQLKELCYNLANRPAIIGKSDAQGRPLLRSTMDLNSNDVAIAIARSILTVKEDAFTLNALRRIEGLVATRVETPPIERTPYFCAGCPHSSSTHLPRGSRGMAGIGCAYLSQFMDRNVDGFTQMGGEGATWIGEAPFSSTDHIFQNLGDGTYFHSGSLAVRAAVAAEVNITFKILYNDAVAMTGGQAHDGTVTPWAIANQVHAEGVKAIAIVTDEPKKYADSVSWPPGTTIDERRNINAVQSRLRDTPGTTVLIYDQTCAAEKRRRRKRKIYPDPAKRLFINTAVCEGCGDCGISSNCTALLPKETPLGRKREIDQSACNKDYSCVNGFCPSFVSVIGGELHRPANPEDATASASTRGLPDPALPSLDDGYNIVITGVGGTGVITLAALLGMAAHMEKKGGAVLDMTGLAQKGGAVVSHVRLHGSPGNISTVRIADGGADLLLGCDSVVTAGSDVLRTASDKRSRAVVNAREVMPGRFALDADLQFPGQQIDAQIRRRVGHGNMETVNASQLATDILGDSIAGNLILLGYAYQRGLIPLSAESLLKAIELNGVAVAMNQRAFLLGREAAVGRQSATAPVSAPQQPALDEIVEHRMAFLAKYQDSLYAARYQALVERVTDAERRIGATDDALAVAAAKYYFKLLAYKDEYEVARLYADPAFMDSLSQTFSGDFQLRFHLAPPLIARRDKETGYLIKREFGGWMMFAFRCLAKVKRLRGSRLDIFGYSGERRMERRLIADYESLLDDVIAGLSPSNHQAAIQLAELPDLIRGFGHVKAASVSKMEIEKARRKDLFESVGAN